MAAKSSKLSKSSPARANRSTQAQSSPRRTPKVAPIPRGYHAVTPYLIIKNATEALAFYKRAFGAKERMRITAPDGRIGHVEIVIGDSAVMISDEYPEMNYRGPLALGGTPVSLHLYVKDVDATFRQALSAGGKEERPVRDQFYGDRSGTLVDPFGHKWHLSSRIENIAPADMQRRADAAMKKPNNQS